MSEKIPSFESKEPIITREQVLEVFRSLHDKGIKDPEDYNNPEVNEAQDLLTAWAGQESKAVEGCTMEERLRMSVSHATLLIDAGFVDPEVNLIMLQRSVGYLEQYYESAVEEETEDLKKLAEDLLKRIHEINDILGEERFEYGKDNDIDNSTAHTVEGGYVEGVGSKLKKLRTLCPILLENSDDSETKGKIKDILDPRLVKDLTDDLPSRGYVNSNTDRGYVFIKLTEDISLYGETDSRSFKLDKFEIISTIEARNRISQMETDENLSNG